MLLTPVTPITNSFRLKVYLFLKEIVHNNMDLSERKEMIHDYIVTKRVGEQNAGLIPELLDLMLVEEELFQVGHRKFTISHN